MDRHVRDISAVAAQPDERSAARRSTLERIAALLDCEVAAFAPGSQQDDPWHATSELIALWHALPDAAARDAVLSRARALARKG